MNDQAQANPAPIPNTTRIAAAILVLVSLAFAFSVTVFATPLHATPADTRDSLGHTMGFNDEFSREHYAIIAQHVSIPEALMDISIYQWILLAMHALAIGLIVRASEYGLLRFSAFQLAIFPIGPLGLPFLIAIPIFVLREEADRETFVDMPFVEALSQSFWLISVALIIVLLLRDARVAVADRVS